MFHKNRKWTITQIASAEELAKQLTDYRSFVLCTGFRLGSLLFLNDSLSEDSALEFAVVLEDDKGYRYQVESITFGWLTYQRALEKIQSLQKGNYYQPSKVTPSFDLNPHHSCCLCA